MNTDAEAKDTKYKTDKEKVSETSKGADKETRKEADTPVKETGSEKESAGRSSVPPVNTEDKSAFPGTPACQAPAVKGSHGRNDNRSEGRIYSFLL